MQNPLRTMNTFNDLLANEKTTVQDVMDNDKLIGEFKSIANAWKL